MSSTRGVFNSRLAKQVRCSLHADCQTIASCTTRSTTLRFQHQFAGVARTGSGNKSLRPWHDRRNSVPVRFLSTKVEDEKVAEETSAAEAESGAGEPIADETTAEAEEATTEESREDQLENQVKDLKDQLLRSLAEQENTRRIAKRDVETARSFAVTSFAKSLLDTSDNLARALEAVPPEYRQDSENHPVLATLYEGIKMTDENLTKSFAKNGLTKFGVVGEKFDPNLHEALFEYPDETAEAGTVGQVMKVGFMLNKRVIRPAEVGVVKEA